MGRLDSMRVTATILQPAATAAAAATESHTWNSIDRVTFSINDLSTLPPTCYIFLDRASYNRLGHNRATLLASFNVPTSLARQCFVDFNGYFGTHTSLDINERLESCTLWLRCLSKLVRASPLTMREDLTDDMGSDRNYTWFEMDFFTHWTAPNRCRVLCIDTPPSFQAALLASLQELSAIRTADGCAMIRAVVTELISVLDRSVWRLRDHVRSLEQARRSRQKHFDDMHDLARHGTQLSEV